MSGPIVRSGASPEFSEGWDRIFGKKTAGEKPRAASAPGKAALKSAKKAVASVKKAVAKAASKPKKSGKK